MIKILKYTLALAIVAVSVFGAREVSAIPIEGDIAFQGIFNQPAFTLAGGATDFTGNPAFASFNLIVNGVSGDYTGLSGGVTQVGFSYAPPFTPVTPLWSLVISPTTSFDLQSVTITENTGTFLSLKGWGMAYMDGYDPTPGSWTLQATADGGFKLAIETTSVPDGGATVALLGITMFGVAIVRSKLQLT